jgi:hypothetical protein
MEKAHPLTFSAVEHDLHQVADPMLAINPTEMVGVLGHFLDRA